MASFLDHMGLSADIFKDRSCRHWGRKYDDLFATRLLPETKAEVRFLDVFLADLCRFLEKGAEDWAWNRTFLTTQGRAEAEESGSWIWGRRIGCPPAGGLAGITVESDTTGLSLSTKTTSTLSQIWRRKNLSWRSRTLQGPLYKGERDETEESSRINTKSAWMRELSKGLRSENATWLGGETWCG